MAEIKKMTQSEMYDFIAERMVDYPEVVEFCNLKKTQIAKKNSYKGNAEIQEENETIKDMVFNALVEFGKGVTATELLTNENLANYITREGKKLSSQKVTYILKSMGDKVENYKDKKASLYRLK